MPTLHMLNVAIGIVFIFLLLSLICTAIGEMIEAWLKRRATDLEKGIRELLRGAKNAKGEDMVRKIYEHPLIAGLYRGNYIPNGNKLPSYIPASNFTLALLDAVLPATPESLSGSVGGGSPVTPSDQPAPFTDVTQPKLATSPIVIPIVIKETKPINEDAPPMGSQDAKFVQGAPRINLKSIREAILRLPPSLPRDGILALVDAAGGDINKARQNVENWYNTSMDRVSGWYKRRIQKILFAIGFVLAVAMNADTIAIFKGLSNDPVLQNSLVLAAQREIDLSKQTADTSATARERAENNISKLSELRLPIGWDWDQEDKSIIKKNTFHMPNYYLATFNKSNWLLKIIGWLITGLAVSLGAPFWFDMLNKIMVIRSTVKPHEKSPEEPSQDTRKNKS